MTHEKRAEELPKDAQRIVDGYWWNCPHSGECVKLERDQLDQLARHILAGATDKEAAREAVEFAVDQTASILNVPLPLGKLKEDICAAYLAKKGVA